MVEWFMSANDPNFGRDFIAFILFGMVMSAASILVGAVLTFIVAAPGILVGLFLFSLVGAAMWIAAQVWFVVRPVVVPLLVFLYKWLLVMARLAIIGAIGFGLFKLVF